MGCVHRLTAAAALSAEKGFPIRAVEQSSNICDAFSVHVGSGKSEASNSSAGDVLGKRATKKAPKANFNCRPQLTLSPIHCAGSGGLAAGMLWYGCPLDQVLC